MRAYLAFTYPNPPQLWWIPDDAYYYFGIAKNFGEYGRLTFDGVHVTNGFHPLWQSILIAMEPFVSGKVEFIRASLLLSGFLAGLAAIPLFKYVQLRSTREAAYAAVSIWLFMPGLIVWQLSGMENVVYALAVFVFLLVITEWKMNNRGHYLAIGLAAGLVVLSRLDSVLLIALIYLFILLVARLRGEPGYARSVLKLGIATAAIVTPYFIFNVSTFGALLPVSGSSNLLDGIQALTSSIGTKGLMPTFVQNIVGYFQLLKFNTAQAAVDLLQGELSVGTSILAWTLILFWVLMFASWGVKILRENGHWRAFRTAAAAPSFPIDLALFTFLGIHILLMSSVFASTVGHSPWYFVPPIAIALLWAPALFLNNSFRDWLRTKFGHFSPNRQINSSHAVAGAIVISLIIMLGLVNLYDLRRYKSYVVSNHWTTSSMALVNWMETGLKDGASVGAWDAGLWGYFYENGITNLDGVVNSPSYLQVIRSGNLGEYIDEQGIEYLIVFDAWNQCRRYEIARCLSGKVLYSSAPLPLSDTRSTHIELIELSSIES